MFRYQPRNLIVDSSTDANQWPGGPGPPYFQTKYMSTIEKLFTIVNNLKVGKGKLSITRKKNYQKSRPKIMSADVDQLQRK